MIAHIIVDPHRPVDNMTLYNELKTQQIDWRMWSCVRDTQNVIRSINLSHKQIVKYAKDNGLPEICIMEEDVWFMAPGAWQYFLRNKPADYDLYLAGAYALNPLAKKRLEEQHGPVEIHNFAGLHCYMISERYYDRFLSIPEWKHIDDQPGMGVFYVLFPFAALQHPGWSSTSRNPKSDYNCSIPLHHRYEKEV